MPKQKTANQDQVDRAIKLANEFPDVVAAVSVGNETQVFWSFHKVELSTLIRYVRNVRNQIKQPVTVGRRFQVLDHGREQATRQPNWISL